ncbi:hypothetical protein T484DRAFT_1924036 [Baffinella frigidus]|nr:hypothetical protein T484DRAFT_1924036 [Cryptophyta sp. CCMP2293]
MDAGQNEHGASAPVGGIKDSAAEQLDGAPAPEGGIKDTAAELGGIVGGTSSAEQQEAQDAKRRQADAGGVDSSPPKVEAIAEQAQAAEAKRQKLNSGGAAVPDAATVPGSVSAADVCWNAVRKAGEAAGGHAVGWRAQDDHARAKAAADMCWDAVRKAGEAAAGGHAAGSSAQADHASANVKPYEPMTGPAGAMPYPVLSGWIAHTCSTCSKEYATASRLRTHEKSHNAVKPFPCDKCDKSFGTASARSRHEPVHTGVKPYKCETCDKKFSDPSSLMRHERVHVSAVNAAPGQT